MRFRHFLLSLAFHGAVLALLVIGVQCSPKMQPPAVMEAVLVTGRNEQARTRELPPEPDVQAQQRQIQAQRAAAEEAARQAAEQARRTQEEQRIEQERRLQEEERRRDLQAEAQRRAEAEQAEIARKKVEEEERRRQEEEQRREAERLERERQAEEQRKREEARKREEERKRQEEAARKAAEERRRREQEMAQALQAEEERMAQAAYITGVQNDWVAAIQRVVRNNWLRPPGLSPELICEVRVEILPNGQIVNARISRPSGSAVYDDSVLKAVYKSDPLPLPADPAAFERVLSFTFTPASLGF